MSNSGLFETHKKEDCEAHTTRLMGAWLEKLTDRIVTHIKAAMEARRYRDPDARGPDPDAPPVTAEDLERFIKRIAREQEPGFRGNYYESGGRDRWIIPGLVTLAVSGIIGNVVQAMAVSALRQEVTDLKAEVERVEKIVEPRYRSAP